MPSDKLKIGVLGTGGFGQVHLSCYQNNENCEIVAVASRTEKHSKMAARKFSIPYYYHGDDWRKLFSENDLDIVSICTPNYLHAPMILEAIENEINILCEKPICISKEELNEIESHLNKKKVIFFSSFQKRYIPPIIMFKDVIEKGLLGDIRYIRYRFSHLGPYKSWRPISEEKWFYDIDKAGGGVLIDLGVYCIDLIRFLFGDYKNLIFSMKESQCYKIEGEDSAFVIFKVDDNITGEIDVSWCFGPLEYITLMGNKGWMILEFVPKYQVFYHFYWKKKLAKNKLIQKMVKWTPTSRNYQQQLINHFVNCVINGTQEHPDFIDGKRAVEFVLDAYSFKESQNNIK
ncbi:MAG: Gfo/Idh/MocA family protein [Promethearchaeota archaeon]